MPRDPINEARRQWVQHGWVEAADGMTMVTSVTRVHQLLSERVDGALRPLDLSFARYEILMVLSFSRRGAMPMARLGSLLQVHPTSVTSAVERLERDDLVRRSRSDQDRRVVLCALTPAGRERADRATAVLNRDVFEMPGLDAATVRQLTALLSRVRAGAGDPVDPLDPELDSTPSARFTRTSKQFAEGSDD